VHVIQNGSTSGLTQAFFTEYAAFAQQGRCVFRQIRRWAVTSQPTALRLLKYLQSENRVVDTDGAPGMAR